MDMMTSWDGRFVVFLVVGTWGDTLQPGWLLPLLYFIYLFFSLYFGWSLAYERAYCFWGSLPSFLTPFSFSCFDFQWFYIFPFSRQPDAPLFIHLLHCALWIPERGSIEESDWEGGAQEKITGDVWDDCAVHACCVPENNYHSKLL